MSYLTRVIETPYMIRVYNYQKPIHKGFKKLNQTEKRAEGEKSEKNINRVKEKLALTIQCNIRPFSKFMTFTTKENMRDRSAFLKKWNAFRTKFKQKYGFNIKYSAVTETQDRGAWHLHVVAYNLTDKLDLKAINRLWVRNPKLGNVDVKVVDHHTNMFKYLIKYLTKEELQLNKKAVLNSYELEQPTEWTMSENVTLAEVYGSPDFSKSWPLYHGDIQKDKEKNSGALFDHKVNYCNMVEYHKIQHQKPTPPPETSTAMQNERVISSDNRI